MISSCCTWFFPRGERHMPINNGDVVWKFQSTFPRGERPARDANLAEHFGISIHVPAWGTTETDIIWKIWYSNFNPRSRVGNDKRYQEFALRYLDFNPRSRVGNDCCIKKIEYGGYNFNPRSRVGNDIVFRSEPDEHSDFNPRSRVGNDRIRSMQRMTPSDFNPRSRVGNDR